jgi:hypothetical protein
MGNWSITHVHDVFDVDDYFILKALIEVEDGDGLQRRRHCVLSTTNKQFMSK